MTYTISRVYKAAGYPCTARPIIDDIVAGQEEMTWYSSKSEAAARVLASIEQNARLELCCFFNGQLVGIAVLMDDADDHVGVCLSVQWRWVHPDHRTGKLGYALQRQIIQVAKWAGHKVLAYTKTLGPGRYELTYLPLEKHRGQKSKEGIQGS